MISLLIGLLLLLPIEQIYGPGAISYADLDRVAEVRNWEGVEAFDLLIAPSNCNLLGRWVWVISKSGVRSGLIVDCESPEHVGQMSERGLLFDGNDKTLIGEQAYFVVR